jgi:nicotinic acid mononucleotide adenylyltransferase
MACSSSDWVSVSQWEATCAGFVDFPRVTRSISEFVKLETKIPRLTPFYICGSDLIIRCRLYHGARQFGVVGVSRPGWKPNEQVAEIIEEAIKDQANRRFYLVEGDSVDVSSTKIREHLANNDIDALKQLTYPDVAEALLTRDLRAIRHEALQAWPDFGHNLSLSPTASSSKWKKQEPKSRGGCAIM